MMTPAVTDNEKQARSRTSRQADAILDHMREGNRITQREAIELFGCMRLAARIHDLKADGWCIVSRPKKFETRLGPTTIAEYYMPDCVR